MDEGRLLPLGALTIDSMFVRQTLRTRQLLWANPAADPGLVLVVDGLIKTYESRDGIEVLVGTAYPGEFVVERRASSEGWPMRSVAGAPSQIAAMTADRWETVRETGPRQLLEVLTLLWQQQQLSNEGALDRSRLTVPGRVARLLVEVMRRIPPGGCGTSTVVEHGLSQAEIADLVGASRETVNKALAQLVNGRVIETRIKSAVVLDHAALRSLARVPPPTA